MFKGELVFFLSLIQILLKLNVIGQYFEKEREREKKNKLYKSQE